jgi:hypothetical protein
MTQNKILKRPAYAFMALLLMVVSIVPLLQSKAHAYGLVATRSIALSSSADGNTADGKDVTYDISFNVPSTNPIGGVVLDFCSDFPIIGATCTAPTGFDLHKATLAVTIVSGLTGFTRNATASTANNQNSTLILSNGSAFTPTAGQTMHFTLGTAAANDGVENPHNSNTTFYARVLTYDTAADALAYSATALGGGTGVIDAGGFALSTASEITVTSKVMERLTFCVYTRSVTSGTGALGAQTCGSSAGNSVTLGDTNGVLDPSGPYVDKRTQYDIATNASQGATLSIKGPTLTSGSFTVSGVGATAAKSAAGTEQFGFCTYQSTATIGAADIAPVALYNGTGGGTGDCSTTTETAETAAPGGNGAGASEPFFAFDTASVNTTYGQVFANKPAGASCTGVIAFIGNIANTTEAGIYSTPLLFVATGKY